jgi:hypothetical protein
MGTASARAHQHRMGLAASPGCRVLGANVSKTGRRQNNDVFSTQQSQSQCLTMTTLNDQLAGCTKKTKHDFETASGRLHNLPGTDPIELTIHERVNVNFPVDANCASLGQLHCLWWAS